MSSYSERFKSPSYFQEEGHLSDKKMVLSWDCTGDHLGVGNGESMILLDVGDGGMKKSTTVRTDGDISFLDFHPSSSNIFLTSSPKSGKTKLWDTREKSKATWEVENGAVCICARFAPDGNTIATVTEKNELKVIDVKSGKVLRSHKFILEVNEVEWDSSGEFLFICTGQGKLDMLHYETLKSSGVKLCAHPKSCRCITMDSNRKVMATGGYDSSIAIFDVDELICTTAIHQFKSTVERVHLSYNGDLLTAVTQYEKNSLIFDTNSGDVVFEMIHDREPFTARSFAWHPSKIVLAYERKKSGSSGMSVVGIAGLQ
eukprot:m.14971 g.14971  ORF g.14971 m.14971 type:complete len:315 (+) comp4399_c1_seq1:123-1067(+)